MKQMLLCMLEPSTLEKFNYENLPMIPHTPENVQTFMEMHNFISTYQRKFYQRAVIYAFFMILMYCSMAIFIYVQFDLLGREVEPRQEGFMTLALINTMVVVLLFFMTTNRGTDANSIDQMYLGDLQDDKLVNSALKDKIGNGQFYRFMLG